jgi:hypothetical protein
LYCAPPFSVLNDRQCLFEHLAQSVLFALYYKDSLSEPCLERISDLVSIVLSMNVDTFQ